MGNTANKHTHGNSNSKDDERERKYMKELAGHILLLATLVATVTYSAGFAPPGGVWEYNSGHLPGDPIIRSTQHARYLAFFYCNAIAFASSLMVLVLVLLLCFVRRKDNLRTIVIPLVLVMLAGLLSLIGAYAAGTFRDTFTAVYTSLLVAAVFVYVAVEWVLASMADRSTEAAAASGGASRDGERPQREVLMLLATFALTVTYAGGLSTPGGFWDSTEGGNRPGDPVIRGARLAAFFVCNTTAFAASLLTVVLLLIRKLRRIRAASVTSVIMLFGLLGSYFAGSSRDAKTTVYLGSLIGVILVEIVLQIVLTGYLQFSYTDVSRLLEEKTQTQDARVERKERAYSTYIQYLATLALTITFQAGLHPPGGLWQDNADGHKAGDPILRTTNPRRYNAFFYCNSVAFVASLVCMILVQIRPLLKQRTLGQAMILDLLGLVGAYAIGSCREETATVYAMGIGGAALVYVVLHVVLVEDTDNHGRRRFAEDDDRSLNSVGYAVFVFAIFVATITYQAGLTPPGGFLLKDDESGHHAGDPVLLHNYPRRYRVFFYCNSTSFMVSIAVIILLVNENLYRPAIKTHALSICTFVSFFCLVAAFAAGTTQHLKTSIYTLGLLALVLSVTILLLLLFFLKSVIRSPPPNDEADEPIELIPVIFEENNGQTREERIRRRRTHANRIYMMTVGILVASVTYQAGLDPPGGSWQGSIDGHHAGDPVMQDIRMQRYRVFFYCNATSFLASICLMLLVLTMSITSTYRTMKQWFRALKPILMLGFLGLLGAYAAGSSRDWKTSVYVVALVFLVLSYFGIHVVISIHRQKGDGNEPEDPDDDVQMTVQM